MMESYKDITTRYLKKNKLRTFLAICGIILSVALMSASLLFIDGMRLAMINKDIDSFGNYHTVISDFSKEDFDKVTNSPGIDNFGLIRDKGKASFEKDNLSINMFVKEVTKDSEDLFAYDLIEGEYGKNENEIALAQDTLIALEKKIGDTIDLKINNETKKFKVVGILDNEGMFYEEGEYLNTALISNPNMTLEDTKLFLRAKEDVIRDTLDNINSIVKDGTITENFRFLTLLNESGIFLLNNATSMMGLIVICIVIIATIIVIRNAFYASIVSRIKDLGLLRAIGATSNQLKKMILKEATIISGIAIPFGLVFGTLAVVVVDKILEYVSVRGNLPNEFGVLLNFDFRIYLFTALLGIVTTYISAFVPMREINKISPLDAVSTRPSIKKVRVGGRLSEKFINFVGIRNIMAYRNIRRNKKRYVSTILALTVSMSITIVFSSYVKNMINDATTYGAQIDNIVDIKISTGEDKMDYLNHIKNDLEAVDGINYYFSYPENFFNIITRESKVKKEFLEIAGFSKIDDNYIENTTNIQSVDLTENLIDILNKNLIKGKIDLKYMKENNGIILNNNVSQYFYDENEKFMSYKGSLYNFNIGDKIYLTSKDVYDSSSKKSFDKDAIKDFEIVAIVDGMNGVTGEVPFIVDTNILNTVFSSDELLNVSQASIAIDVLAKSETDEFSALSEKVENISKKNTIVPYNKVESDKQQKLFLRQLQFLVYGFLTVISFISFTNIFNTMSTNIIFRDKEISCIRALGMSKKDIRNMIIKEGILYGVISGAFSIVIGIIINFILYRNMIELRIFDFVVHWDIIITIITVGIIVGILSSIIPLRRINKANIIDNLK